jgi:outer membrane lipoprotein carrier protein
MLRLVLTFMMLLPALVQADAKVQLEQFSKDLQTLSGQFRQVIFDSDGFALEESEGKLFFMAPDRFRWDYEAPFPQQLVADGEKLWHFDQDLEQVTVRPQPEDAESALMVLTRPDLLENSYSIEPSGLSDELHFMPNDPEAGFERASLRFFDGLPVALEFTDRLVGQITLIELMNLKRNPELPEELFQFEPPPGVDVLEGY